jgi:hypothetical protein
MDVEQLKTYIIIALTIFGALTGIARVIVALTPTSKDDIIVGRISKHLNTIAKVFGLDLMQGRHKK